MKYGKYTGDVVTKWVKNKGDDRDMVLVDDFSYTDADGKVWSAPQGSVINGASIPQALWSTIGPPFVGDYRRASVIHDVACDQKSEPHDAVHRMFFQAMRADKVGWVKANVMYQAVARFGPTWTAAGGVSKTVRRPRKETVLEFAEAAEQAARQTPEAEGLDAVRKRTDELVLQWRAESRDESDRAGGRSPAASGDHADGDESGQQRASRIRRQTGKAGETATASSTDLQMENVAPVIRKQLAGVRRLGGFRRESMKAPAQQASPDDQLQESLSGAARAIEDAAGSRGQLSKSERLRLLDQALVMLEQNYVHLPLKRSMHAIAPIQSLRLLREEILLKDADELEDVIDFHRRLLSIFHSNRDLHTNYFLPSPFAEMTAFLPFLVEDFFEPGDPQRRFLVTRLFSGFSQPGFEVGVELLRWNGVPIERAVEINGNRFAGSNLEARRARGLETMTVRSLLQSLPPEEDFVLVEFRDEDGRTHEIRVDWSVFQPNTTGMAAVGELELEAAVAQGIDLELTIVREVKKVLFAPEVVSQAAKMSRRKAATSKQGLVSLMPDVISADPVTVAGGEFGYVRLRTFSVSDADAFVAEFVRLVDQLPQEGLILDVRGNGGGLILAGEQLLQTLTPKRIEPTLFQFRNTPLNRRLVDNVDFLKTWRESMRQAVLTGATYSQGFAITDVDKANEIGQVYHGPVVLITDALCYSTTDIFAAGFQDHRIGQIIGVDDNTGAGGANVWDHNLLTRLLRGDAESPYEPLPSNSGMRISIRRTIRVGESNGTVLEDLGVVPDRLHRMTRDDLLDNNSDLLAVAGQVLRNQAVFSLSGRGRAAGAGEVELNLKTGGIERLDFYERGRPLGSIDVTSSTTDVLLAVEDGEMIETQGFSDGELVAARIIPVT